MENRVWDPDIEINSEGVKTIIQSNHEQTKSPQANPAKYLDQSCVQDALKELIGR